MTLQQEIEKAVITYDTHTICYCEERQRIDCKPHVKLQELVSSLVSQALQEAERRIEGECINDEDDVDIDYMYSFNNGVEHALASLRELREGLKG